MTCANSVLLTFMHHLGQHWLYGLLTSTEPDTTGLAHKIY